METIISNRYTNHRTTSRAIPGPSFVGPDYQFPYLEGSQNVSSPYMTRLQEATHRLR